MFALKEVLGANGHGNMDDLGANGSTETLDLGVGLVPPVMDWGTNFEYTAGACGFHPFEICTFCMLLFYTTSIFDTLSAVWITAITVYIL